MKEEDFKNKFQERWKARRQHHERGRVWGGFALLVVGGLLLAKAGGVVFPTWFFSWPVFLIGIGLFIGLRHKFRGFGWLFPIAIGSIFLADRLSPDLNLRPYVWPTVFIGAGLFFIFRPRGRHFRRGDNPGDTAFTETATADDRTSWQDAMKEGNDVTDVTAVFGGVKKNLLTKNFRGGDVTTFMGGAELNLMQADFTGRVTIDCFNMFGGTKLIVPPDWEVQSDIVAVFGGVEDKRPPLTTGAPTKVLLLDGTCIFGGVEIRSY